MADLQFPPSSAKKPGESPLSKPPTTTSQLGEWDVFLNHRGCDTKSSLASILHESFEGRARVFLDVEELKLGNQIPDEIQHAIKSASVHIAILSENYAYSPWCLAELALMLGTSAKIVPVFYNIEPSVPRYCMGAYADAFQKHESDVRYKKEDIKIWKRALYNVSLLDGPVEWNERSSCQGKLIKGIIDTVLEEVYRKSPLVVAEHPVGLKEAVRDFNSTRESDNPKLVGIVGMCGSGKTTLAKQLFNSKRFDFRASCILFEVCEASATNKLPALQRKLLKELMHVSREIDTVPEGKQILESGFKSIETTSRFLIILDGIDHKNQLEALLVEKLLQTDSLIIITSRDRSLFVSYPKAKLYEMKTMDEKHSRELFCMHAFKCCDPVKLRELFCMHAFKCCDPVKLRELETLVERFLKVCDGLPLLLKESGALLHGQTDRMVWELELSKLSKMPNNDIKVRLQMSYEPLEREEKQIFLDSACFFVDEEEKMAIQIWNASGWNGQQGLRTLKYKSLIEVYSGETLKMHDLFQHLGRDIASDRADQNFPHRIWKELDIKDLEKQGIQKILELTRKVIFRSFLHLRRSEEKPEPQSQKKSRHTKRSKNSSAKDDSELSKVHVFLGNDTLEPEFLRSSSDLLWLKWEKCHHKMIPSWICMKSLRHLEIIGGNLEQLWQDNPEAPLRLEEIIIQWNPLTELPMQFGNLKNLEHIDFHGCGQLEMLLKSFSCLTQLKFLDLSMCGSLRIEPCNLSISQTQSTYKGSLKTLRLLGTKVDEGVLHQIVKLTSLESLTIGDDSLQCLPSVRELRFLESLTIRNSKVEDLPEGIGELANLKSLEVEDCPLTKLTFRNSRQIKSGDVKEETAYLNNSNAAVFNWHSEWDSCTAMHKLENITVENTTVKMVSISGEICPRLETLNLKENGDLVEVDLTLLSTLECLCLSGCSNLKRISGTSNLTQLKELAISGCCKLEELPSVARLSALERFTADKCWKLQNTGGVERLQGLKEFRLVADNSAIWNCFQGLQRLPSQEMIVGGRAAAVAVAGNGVEWINLSPSDHVDEAGTSYVIGGDKMKVWSSPCSTSVVMIICFLIHSSSEGCFVSFKGSPGVVDLDGAVWIKGGEWIVASVFTIEEADVGNMERLQVLLAKSPHYELKKAFIAGGSEEKITEIMNRMFVSMNDARAPEHCESSFEVQDSMNAPQSPFLTKRRRLSELYTNH